MIIYYKTKFKPVCAESIPHETCPLCHKEGTLTANLYASYMALAFLSIPILYTGKQVSVQCTSCQHVLREVNPYPSRHNINDNKLSADVVSTIDKIKKNRIPLWRRLGLSTFMICAIVIPVFIFANIAFKGNQVQEAAQQTDELLMHPQVGDIYKSTINTMGDNSTQSVFVLMKVTQIKGDTMYVVRSKGSINRPFTEKDWAALPRSADAFEDTPYKINLARFVEEDHTMHRRGYFYPFENAGWGNPKVIYDIGSVWQSFDGKLKIVEREGK